METSAECRHPNGASPPADANGWQRPAALPPGKPSSTRDSRPTSFAGKHKCRVAVSSLDPTCVDAVQTQPGPGHMVRVPELSWIPKMENRVTSYVDKVGLGTQ